MTVDRHLLTPPAGSTAQPDRRPSIIEQYAGTLAPMLRGEAQQPTNETTEEDE